MKGELNAVLNENNLDIQIELNIYKLMFES